MKIELKEHSCIVTSELGDLKFYGINAGESRLMYHMKPILEKMTERKWIKKRMHKDGHLVNDRQQYLRTTKPPHIMIYNSNWAIRGAEQALNTMGRVTFCVEREEIEHDNK